MGPLDYFALALQKTRIVRALRVMRERSAQLDFDGAARAEKILNEELDILGRYLSPRRR